MDILLKDWFTEISPDDLKEITTNKNGLKHHANLLEKISSPNEVLWSGQAFSLRVEKVLFHQKTQFQEVLVFKSRSYGNVLVLDGVIQCTEKDEFAYQEMLAHLPMFAHPNPKKILIIGGGDGGILREVLRHKNVEHVTLCEIDETVIEVAKKFLPTMACEFDNPKLELVIDDGILFLPKHENEFDVIITDSSDPVESDSPAHSLFQSNFYELIKKALRPNGVFCAQGESPWLDSELIKDIMEQCRKLFPQVTYAVGTVPTFVSGLTGYLVCSLSSSEKNNVKMPLYTPTTAILKQLGIRFYNSEVHKAAFALPTFLDEVILLLENSES